MNKLDLICDRIRKGCLIEEDKFSYYESGIINLGNIKVNVKIERIKEVLEE